MSELGLTAAASSSMIGETISPMVDESGVYDRDLERKMIIEQLLEEEREISVIPIVGMGGVGKTTLVKRLCEDLRVLNHFDLKAWASGSDGFEVKRITKSILNSAKVATSDTDDLIGLQDKVKAAFTGKRFLFVIDDLRGENLNLGDWNVLLSPFRVGAPGSKIIVTSRDISVGCMIGTVNGHYLEELSNDDRWSLLGKRASGDLIIDTRPNLPFIGEIRKKIVEMCTGIPLAVKNFGRCLCFELEEPRWEDILNREIWGFAKDNAVLPVLKDKYDGLPSHLRRCFSYHSIVLEDYEVEKEELLRSWRAEDFAQQQNGTRQLEDLAVETRFGFKKQYNFQALWMWLFVIGNLSCEILASAFDQVSSPNKPGFALAGLIMSLVSVAVCVTQFIRKARDQKVQWGSIRRLYYPTSRDGRLFGSFADIFGLICAILQVIFSAIQYGFFHRHADNPINFSTFPVIFAIFVVGSKLIKNCNELPCEGHSAVDHGEVGLEELTISSS